MLSEYLSLQPWHLGSTSEGSQTEPRPTRAGQRCWVHLLGVPMPLLSLGGGGVATSISVHPATQGVLSGAGVEKAAATPRPAPLSSRPEAARPPRWPNSGTSFVLVPHPVLVHTQTLT